MLKTEKKFSPVAQLTAAALSISSFSGSNAEAAEAKAPVSGKAPIAQAPTTSLRGWNAPNIFRFRDAKSQSTRHLELAGSDSVLALGSAIKEKNVVANTLTCLKRSDGTMRWSSTLTVEAGQERESINESVCTGGLLIISSRITDLNKEKGESSGRYRLRTFDVATGMLKALRDFSLLDPNETKNSATDNARGTQARMRITSNGSNSIFVSTPSYCGAVSAKDLENISPFHSFNNLSATTVQIAGLLFFVDYKTPNVLNVKSISTGRTTQAQLPNNGSINHIQANGSDGILCLYGVGPSGNAKQMTIGYDSKLDKWSKPVDLGATEATPLWFDGTANRPWLVVSRKEQAVVFNPLSIGLGRLLAPTSIPQKDYLGSLALTDRHFAICTSKDGGKACNFRVYEISNGNTVLKDNVDYIDPNSNFIFSPSNPPILQHASGEVFLSMKSDSGINIIKLRLTTPGIDVPSQEDRSIPEPSKADISKK